LLKASEKYIVSCGADLLCKFFPFLALYQLCGDETGRLKVNNFLFIYLFLEKFF